MRDDIVGRRSDWAPVLLEKQTFSLFLEAAELAVEPFILPSDGEASMSLLPPAVLAALRPDADALGVPGDAPVRLNAGNQFRWKEPVRFGTPLERRTRIADAYDKHGTSGRLEFYVLESLFRRSTDGVVVAEATSTTIRRYPSSSPAAPGSPRRSTPQRTDDDDVPRTELEPVVFRPSSRQLVKYAAATGDYYEAHYDHKFAVEHCLPGVIVHGLLKLAWCTRALQDWFGPRCFVRDMDVQYRGLDLVDRPWTVYGGVRDAAETDATRVVLRGVSADGAPTVVGAATVTHLRD